MFKMASGVSFVKRFSKSPAGGANTKDAKRLASFVPLSNYSEIKTDCIYYLLDSF